jgi:prepilin-type N-terminal cleavage/methylation domain-containing protein
MSLPQIPARRSRIALRASDGFTLMEVLVAMALTVVVMASAGQLLYAGQKVSSADTENATAQSELQGQLDRMIRDLRQATDVTQQTTGQITVILLDGTQLSYKCDAPDQGANAATYNACYRLTAAAPPATLPAPGAANLVIPRLYRTNSAGNSYSVFGYTLSSVDDTLDPDDEAPDANNTPDPAAPVYFSIHVELPSAGELTAGAGRSRRIILDGGSELRNIRYTQTGNTQ